jgi:hypothetical protein
MGCPKLTAPPWTFVLFGSISRDFKNANTTTLNASFTSHSATSSFFTPQFSSSCNTVTLTWIVAHIAEHWLHMSVAESNEIKQPITIIEAFIATV